MVARINDFFKGLFNGSFEDTPKATRLEQINARAKFLDGVYIPNKPVAIAAQTVCRQITATAGEKASG